MLVKRKIIEIDESLCNGCGKCIVDCAEGAIKIVNGKAKLISDNLCDGLGACMGGCPVDALKIVERVAEGFDEEAVEKHLNSKKKGCPSLSMSPELSPLGSLNWPVQIGLISPDSDIFHDKDVLIAADCVPASLKDFHGKLVNGRNLMIGCPKLDNGRAYIDKFTEIFKKHDLKSLTLAKMEVPCCSGLERIINEAVSNSGKEIKVEVVVVSRAGELIG